MGSEMDLSSHIRLLCEWCVLFSFSCHSGRVTFSSTRGYVEKGALCSYYWPCSIGQDFYHGRATPPRKGYKPLLFSKFHDSHCSENGTKNIRRKNWLDLCDSSFLQGSRGLPPLGFPPQKRSRKRALYIKAFCPHKLFISRELNRGSIPFANGRNAKLFSSIFTQLRRKNFVPISFESCSSCFSGH